MRPARRAIHRLCGFTSTRIAEGQSVARVAAKMCPAQVRGSGACHRSWPRQVVWQGPGAAPDRIDTWPASPRELSNDGLPRDAGADGRRDGPAAWRRRDRGARGAFGFRSRGSTLEPPQQKNHLIPFTLLCFSSDSMASPLGTALERSNGCLWLCSWRSSLTILHGLKQSCRAFSCRGLPGDLCSWFGNTMVYAVEVAPKASGLACLSIM